MKRRILSMLLCIAMFCTILAGCGSNGNSSSVKAESPKTQTAEAEVPVVKLAVYANTGHVFHAISEDKGFYEDEGIKVEAVNINGGTDESLSSLASRKIDIVSTSGTYVPLQCIASNENITICGGYMLTGAMAIVAQPGTEFKGAESFVGETVASKGGLGMHQITGPLLDIGADPNTDVEWMNVPQTDLIEVVRGGDAKYAILPTGAALLAQEAGLEVVAYSSDIFPEYSCCRTFVNSDWLSENSEVMKKVMKCWLRALAVCNADREYAAAALAEFTGLEVEYVEGFMLDEVHFQLQVDPSYKIVKRAWDIDKKIDLFDAEDSVLDEHFNHTLYKSALDECVAEYYNEAPEFYDECLKYYDENNVNIVW